MTRQVRHIELSWKTANSAFGRNSDSEVVSALVGGDNNDCVHRAECTFLSKPIQSPCNPKSLSITVLFQLTMCPEFLHFELDPIQGSVVDGGEVRTIR